MRRGLSLIVVMVLVVSSMGMAWAGGRYRGDSGQFQIPPDLVVNL
jgi:hypothetical protein